MFRPGLSLVRSARTVTLRIITRISAIRVLIMPVIVLLRGLEMEDPLANYRPCELRAFKFEQKVDFQCLVKGGCDVNIRAFDAWPSNHIASSDADLLRIYSVGPGCLFNRDRVH